MKRIVQIFYTICVLLLIVTLAIGLPAWLSPLHAQTPSLKITDIDPTNFPELTVTIQDENLGDVNLQEIKLLEDDQPQPLLGPIQQKGSAGAQIAFLLDISTQADASVRLEIGNTIRSFVDKKILSAQDKMALFAPGEDGKTLVSVIDPDAKDHWNGDWTNDFGAIANLIYARYTPVAPQDSALNDLIVEALQHFDAAVPGPQYLVVFSGDVPTKTSTKSTADIRNANQAGVRIHTVMVVASAANSVSTQRLQEIAAAGNGQPFGYVLQAANGLDSLWESMVSHSAQLILKYRTHQKQPKMVKVQMPHTDKPIEATLPVPALEVLPAEIQILQPASALTLTPTQTLPIVVNWQWSNYPNRQIVRAEYRIKGTDINKQVVTTAPLTQTTLALTGLLPGQQWLEVHLLDDVGVEGMKEIAFSIAAPLAPQPTPTALPAPDIFSKILNTLSTNWPSVLGLGLLVVLIGSVAIFLETLRRRNTKPLAPQPALSAPEEPVQTEVFTGKVTEQWQGDAQPAKAKLTLLTGSVELEPVIYILNENSALGRDRSYADVVLKHKNISRFHCRIQEKGGQFTVMDEGSASGTYINGQRVDIRGQQLKSGDILQLGPIQYRFDVLAPPPLPPVTGSATEGQTEPWAQQAPMAQPATQAAQSVNFTEPATPATTAGQATEEGGTEPAR